MENLGPVYMDRRWRTPPPQGQSNRNETEQQKRKSYSQYFAVTTPAIMGLLFSLEFKYWGTCRSTRNTSPSVKSSLCAALKEVRVIYYLFSRVEF